MGLQGFYVRRFLGLQGIYVRRFLGLQGFYVRRFLGLQGFYVRRFFGATGMNWLIMVRVNSGQSIDKIGPLYKGSSGDLNPHQPLVSYYATRNPL